jgi:hypothetical protein
MVRLSLFLILPAIVLCDAVGQGPGQGGDAGKDPVVVTEKDVDRVIPVKNGDVVEVRLPSLVPLTWVLDEDQPVLRPREGPPKQKLAEAEPPSDAKPPIVGAGGHASMRYEVSTDREVMIRPEWMYCRFANLDMTKKRLQDGVIPVPPKFTPDLKRTDLREGMTFRIQLDVRP